MLEARGTSTFARSDIHDDQFSSRDPAKDNASMTCHVREVGLVRRYEGARGHVDELKGAGTTGNDQ